MCDYADLVKRDEINAFLKKTENEYKDGDDDKSEVALKSMSDRDAATLAMILRSKTKIENLALDDAKISLDGARALAQSLVVNTSLKSVTLKKGIPVGKFWNPKCEKIDLNSKGYEDIHAVIVAVLMKNSITLKDLGLRDNQITDDGVQAVADGLSNNKHLTYISFRQNKITDAGAKYIAEALKTNTTLKELVLTINKISDKGIEDIAYALFENSSLTDLSIHSNKYGDTAAMAIGHTLETNTTLQNVHLFAGMTRISKKVKSDLKKHKNKKGKAICQ